jgi:hypothetical protein
MNYKLIFHSHSPLKAVMRHRKGQWINAPAFLFPQRASHITPYGLLTSSDKIYNFQNIAVFQPKSVIVGLLDNSRIHLDSDPSGDYPQFCIP